MDKATQEFIEATAKATVAEYARQFKCRFNDSEASNVHALSAALADEGGNHGTLRILIQFGKSWQEVGKSMRRAGLLILIGLVLSIAAAIGLPKLASLVTK